MRRKGTDPASVYRLLYIVTEDWFFVTHFLPLAREAQKRGFHVTVVTRVQDHAREIEAEGFCVIPLTDDRASFGFLPILSTIFRLRSIIARQRPDVVHAIALKSVVLGGLASFLVGESKNVFSLTGLGYVWGSNRLSLSLLRLAVRIVLGFISSRTRSIFTFENEDDCNEFGALQNKIVIGGWGINPEEIPIRQATDRASIRVVYLGRMLKAKGIEETVRAVLLARKIKDIRLELWGTPDSGNLTSLTVEELVAFSQIDGINWCGRAASVPDTWQRADIAILLSEREGMPRSLIEAAAAGLPMVAFDVPGSRSIVRDGKNGILIPPHDLTAAAEALVTLASDKSMRDRMGSEARRDFEERFSVGSVVPRVINLYFELVR